MNVYKFNLVKINSLTGLLNEIIDKNNAGAKPVTVSNIIGFVSCMATLYDADYSIKLNEDENSVHLAIYENKNIIAAIAHDKEPELQLRKSIKIY